MLNSPAFAEGRVAQIGQERGQPCPRIANPLEDLQNLCKMDHADSAVRAPGLWATRPEATTWQRKGSFLAPEFWLLDSAFVFLDAVWDFRFRQDHGRGLTARFKGDVNGCAQRLGHAA